MFDLRKFVIKKKLVKIYFFLLSRTNNILFSNIQNSSQFALKTKTVNIKNFIKFQSNEYKVFIRFKKFLYFQAFTDITIKPSA